MNKIEVGKSYFVYIKAYTLDITYDKYLTLYVHYMYATNSLQIM